MTIHINRNYLEILSEINWNCNSILLTFVSLRYHKEMDNTTGKSIEFLLEQKPEVRIQARVSADFKQLVKQKSRELNLDESGFVRLAVADKLKMQ